MPEPPRADEDEQREFRRFFEEEQLDANDERELLYGSGIGTFPVPVLREMWLRELTSPLALFFVTFCPFL